MQVLRRNYPAINIMVDGGIGASNIDIVTSAGANMIVAGTSVFRAEDPAIPINSFRRLALACFLSIFSHCSAV